MREVRDNPTLKALSEHLYYEFWMLGEALQSLSQARNQQDVNLAIESFGIHARVILDFLFKTSGRKTDVLAVDFLDNPRSWIEFVQDKRGIYDYITRRAGKEIAHLTTDRLVVIPEEKKWKCKELYQNIKELFIEFLKQIPEGRIEQRLILLRD